MGYAGYIYMHMYIYVIYINAAILLVVAHNRSGIATTIMHAPYWLSNASRHHGPC